MESLWLLTIFLVPLVFATPAVMSYGYDVPKVTLYRSLVGLMAALWIIEWGLSMRPRWELNHWDRWASTKRWVVQHPSRWLLLAAGLVLASNLISTLASTSISISLWGSEPGLDGYGFYNILSHLVLFATVATHLKTERQMWRVLSAIVASGLVLSLYSILQYFGLDPLGIHSGGLRVVASLGNPIFVGAFLLMVVPIALAMAIRSNGEPASRIGTMLWVGALTALLMAIAFTGARGPWIGLAVAVLVLLALVTAALGWRAGVRAGMLLAVSAGITWGVFTFVRPSPAAQENLASRALSVEQEVQDLLSFGDVGVQPEGAQATRASKQEVPTPSSIRSRLLLWQGSGELVLRRPWFEFDDRPLPLSLHLFGYGPEFLRYVFPLQRPHELTDPQRETVYRYAEDAHNSIIHRAVELGFFGLASYLFLLAAVLARGVSLLVRDRAVALPNHKLVVSALLASVGGRILEQMLGIPHLSDVALFWTLVAVMAALPTLTDGQRKQPEASAEPAAGVAPLHPGSMGVISPAFKLSLAVVLALALVVFTLINNPALILAEIKATAATAAVEDTNPQRALQQIDGAINLAPDVARYHVQRAKILDRVRSMSASRIDQVQLAQGAYLANQRGVTANPFDLYSRLHLAESAFTLAQLGRLEKNQEALDEYRRITFMMPRYWLSHFLLGRAYNETDQPELAIESYDEAIRLNPGFQLAYNQRGNAYASLGRYQRAIEDYNEAISISPLFSSAYNQRGMAFYHLGQLSQAIHDYGEAIRVNPKQASAYNNRGVAYFEMSRLENSIDDFDKAIQLNPRFAQAYANRAFANAGLNRDGEAQKDADRAVQLGFSSALLDQGLKLQD